MSSFQGYKIMGFTKSPGRCPGLIYFALSGLFPGESIRNLIRATKKCRTSSNIIYNEGISTKVIPVENRIPYPRDMAMGIKNLACREVSKIIGVRPPNVVRVVSIIGRNRRMPAI